jgi:exodeoxyribonuclease V
MVPVAGRFQRNRAGDGLFVLVLRRKTGVDFIAHHTTSVVRQRGCKPVSTIHKLIYNALFDEQKQRWFFVRKTREELAHIKLIIVDEASMVNEKLADDLLSFNIPVLIIGDPAQLPPVFGTSEFMSAPDVMLTEVHRQALDNPILKLANDIRQGRPLPRPGYRAGNALRITDGIGVDPGDFNTVLVGKNLTRRYYNREIRVAHGIAKRLAVQKTPAQAGETVVCLRNDYGVSEPVFNGTTWEIEGIEHDNVAVKGKVLPIVHMEISNVFDGNSTVRVPLECFYHKTTELEWYPGLQAFDFGYALTVHKAQGSEWDSVLLINEASVFGDDARRWLYTAVTRASKRLTIIDYD